MKILVVMVALAAGAAAAEQTNCDTTMAQQGMNLCADRAFLAADAELNDAHADAVSCAQVVGGEAEALLRVAQRAWVPFRDAACKAEAYVFDGGSMQPMIFSYCLARLTEVRRAELIAYSSQY